MNVPSASELHTLNGLISCDENLCSIKIKAGAEQRRRADRAKHAQETPCSAGGRCGARSSPWKWIKENTTIYPAFAAQIVVNLFLVTPRPRERGAALPKRRTRETISETMREPGIRHLLEKRFRSTVSVPRVEVTADTPRGQTPVPKITGGSQRHRRQLDIQDTVPRVSRYNEHGFARTRSQNQT